MRELTAEEIRAYTYTPDFNTALYGEYREEIIKSFREEYESLVELTNNDLTDDLLLESRSNYYLVRDNPVEQCVDEITCHLAGAYQAVNGELDKYYGPDNEITVFLRNLMIVEPVTFLKRRD